MTMRDFQWDFKNFSQNFNKLSDFLEGFVADVADQVSSPRTKQALNSALDLFRPHFFSLGLRISILSPHQIELTLPRKSRNLDETGEILTGVQISTAIEAYKLLWRRNSPEGNFQISVREVRSQFLKPARQDLRLRGELSEIVREARWAELEQNKRTRHQMTLHFYDDQEQMVSEIEIEAELFLKEMLEWK